MGMFTRAEIDSQGGQGGEEMIAAIEKSGATPDHFHQENNNSNP